MSVDDQELTPGQKICHYEILSLLGKGGMGEVYLARDSKLGRRVALKFLPVSFTSDPKRLARFEQEARATSALNHPNLLTIYEVGEADGRHYISAEFIEGETLRQRIARASLGESSLSKEKEKGFSLQSSNEQLKLDEVLNISEQIVSALAAAHAAGIIHRDIKPANIMLRSDGYIKVLDFGLAKLIEQEAAPEDLTREMIQTSTGVRIGTVGYMSPEQVRHLYVDARTDIWSVGVVLYEMVTTSNPFLGPTDSDVIVSILAREQPPLTIAAPGVPEAVEWIVTKALMKDREERYQTARELLSDLRRLKRKLDLAAEFDRHSFPDRSRDTSSQAIATSSSFSAQVHGKAIGLNRSTRRWLLALFILLMIGTLALAWRLIPKSPVAISTPSYRQLTFQRGTISSARFAVDSQTIFYSAAWNGNRFGIFSTRIENPESRAVGMEDADMLAISSTGEMAVLVKRQYLRHFVNQGTLARMPLFGGSPREVLDDVRQADWSPDGSSLAVVHHVADQNQLEFPIGKVLYRTSGDISYPRISPKGDQLAFFEHPDQRDNRGSVALIDLRGNKRVITGEWANAQGLAWSPDGESIWFTASKTGETLSLHKVTLAGQETAVLHVPSGLMIHDISSDGRMLLTAFTESTSIIALPPGGAKEQDLSWLDRGNVYDLSPDGKTFLFQYYGEGSGTNYTSYLRKTDGSPAIRLGAGAALSLSPDGRWVLAFLNESRQLTLLPTGTGEARRIDLHGIEYAGGYSWFPDSQHILFDGRERGHDVASYVLDLDTNETRQITSDGTTGELVAPDGRLFVATDAQRKRFLFQLQGGPPLSISGLEPDDEIIRWSIDGRALFVYQSNSFPIRIYKLELSSGRKELWKEVTPSDPTGVLGVPKIFLSSDEKSYLYQFHRHLSDLYMVENFGR